MKFIIAALLLFSISVQAEERLKNESELGISIVSGNANTENYSLKQTSTYDLDDLNKLKAQGRYIQSKTSGIESSKSWDAMLRYERSLTDWWSAFAAQTAESDVYGGFVQRDSTDVGLKYFLTKTEETQFFAELGYRYQFTQYLVVLPDVDRASHALRAYTEVSHTFSKGTSGKFWVEYIPNFKDKDAYLVNAEPSITSILSEMFSLKTSYLVKYQNPHKGNLGRVAYSDTTFLTTLVAKF